MIEFRDDKPGKRITTIVSTFSCASGWLVAGLTTRSKSFDYWVEPIVGFAITRTEIARKDGDAYVFQSIKPIIHSIDNSATNLLIWEEGADFDVIINPVHKQDCIQRLRDIYDKRKEHKNANRKLR